MQFPLSSTACDALEATLRKRRDDVRGWANSSAYHAFDAALELIHEARIAQANRKIDAKQRKLNMR